MKNQKTLTLSRFSTALLWLARGLTLLILAFFGYMIVGHLIGDEGRPSRPLAALDYALLAALMVSLAGLAVSLKQPLAGALLTLTAVAFSTILNWRMLFFPMTLIPLNAVLYLVSAWTGDSNSRFRPGQKSQHQSSDKTARMSGQMSM